jgi:hypothetical protein
VPNLSVLLGTNHLGYRRAEDYPQARRRAMRPARAVPRAPVN